jgi:7,8-dihydroneopterin aldolase/epimerase/oxygenase
MTQSRYSGDRIFVHDLATECVIGFVEWERRIKQKVVVDLEFSCDCAQAAVRDDVAEVLDYRKVVKRVLSFVESSDCHLVETLAERLAQVILGEFQVGWVRISLSKPGAFRESRDVGVTIERSRGETPAR